MLFIHIDRQRNARPARSFRWLTTRQLSTERYQQHGVRLVKGGLVSIKCIEHTGGRGRLPYCMSATRGVRAAIGKPDTEVGDQIFSESRDRYDRQFFLSLCEGLPAPRCPGP
jgi:hypothetical protein